MQSSPKKRFAAGLVMMICFAAVLIILFLPLFSGKNGLDYLDNLYNSISKGSAYYIPKVKAESAKFAGQTVDLSLTMDDAAQSGLAAVLFKSAGISVEVNGAQLKAKGDLGRIFAACLQDSDDLFHNRGAALTGRYQKNERLMVYVWWQVLKAMEKDLNRQKKFAQAKMAAAIQSKAVECSYNYYKIEPQNIGDRWGIVLFSLLFYVIYTVWYGFSVMYMFEGGGFKLGH
jgi:hypothetical protein